MTDPYTALLLGSAVFAFLLLVFWPDKGALSRWRWTKNAGKREMMEDALKHLYKCELKDITCTVENLARIMSKDSGDIIRTVSRLESMGLLIINDKDYTLTEEGKSYALRIIRIHRLWERYLAEETGIPETFWHEDAERKEHEFTEEEANAISRQLGYPRYDPHGDPIPTQYGDLPPPKGKPLIEHSKGDVVQVIHISDEPASLYAEIVDKGISLGAHIEVLKKTKNHVHILIDGNVHTLTYLQSGNLTVISADVEHSIEEPLLSLASLNIGEKGEVVGISRSCRGVQRRRLMDLGIIPGTIISLEMVSAGGDPKAYNIRGAMIALREEQANQVSIQPVN
jgi:DtxR family Mn-dependent transcriptional regulator